MSQSPEQSVWGHDSERGNLDTKSSSRIKIIDILTIVMLLLNNVIIKFGVGRRVKMISSKSKKYLISTANIISAVSLGLCLLMLRIDPWLLIIFLCSTAISVYLSKSISKEEREKQNTIFTKSLVTGILIPIYLIILLLGAVVVWAIWKTY